MILPVESDGFNSYVRTVDELVENTVFEFLPNLYREYDDVIKSVFNRRYQITTNGYIGKETDMVISGFLFDDIELPHNRRFWMYIKDYVSQLREEIRNKYSTDYEYLRDLSDLYSNMSSVGADDLYGELVQRYDQLRVDSVHEGDLIIPSSLEYLEIRIVTGILLF